MSGDISGESDLEEVAIVSKHHRPRFRFEPAAWDILDTVKDLNADGEPISTIQSMFHEQNASGALLAEKLTSHDFGVNITYYYPVSAIELLPTEDVPRLQSCAVVGNSGRLLLKEDGAFIDSHDAVFRMNLAPVEGYKLWVGEKASFCIVNSHNTKELLSSSSHVRRARRDNKCAHMVLFETATSFTRHSLLRPMLQKFPDTVPLSPIFINRAFRIWAQAQELFSVKNHKTYQRKPMTGYYAVIMALQLCKSVDVFGFDAYTGSTSIRNHYFDNVDGFTNRHSFDFAYDLLKEFQTRGFLTLF